MKKSLCLLALCGVVYSLTLLLPLNTGHAASGPRFTWAAFQRFWEKSATPLVFLRNAQRHGKNYLVDYGYTTMLTVVMQKDIVTGVHISFVGGKENDAGGPQFLRLMHHAITVGTFHWPEDDIRKVRELFGTMGPAPREYRRQSTHFRRGHGPEGWYFTFDYVDDEDNPGGRARLPY